MLHKAAELGNFAYLKWLLKRGAVGRTRTSRDGITPLMFACRHDYIDMVLYLLEFGDSMAIINWSDEFGNTALHYACQGGSPLLVEVLLTCGIKMPHRNKQGEMAIDVARIRRADDIANVMQKYTNKVKDIDIRMHFNSLIFPKEGEWNRRRSRRANLPYPVITLLSPCDPLSNIHANTYSITYPPSHTLSHTKLISPPPPPPPPPPFHNFYLRCVEYGCTRRCF